MGKKDALGRGRGVHISVKTLAVCALAALGTRLMLYALAWGMKCLSAGEMLSFSQTFNSLWVKWDARHYLKIAQQGYVNTGDDRLTLVFFPLYPWLIRAVNILAVSYTHLR